MKILDFTKPSIDRIAAALLAAAHEPKHPSYTAFVEETIVQYRALIAAGYTFSTYGDETPTHACGFVGPYTGSREMFEDLEDNRHLRVYNAGSVLAAGHPLAEYLPEFGITANVVFRAVHDINGHLATRAPFETFDGEIEAYRAHARTYSELAQSALYGETVAQLCHYFSRGTFVPVQICAILPVNEVN